MRAVRTILGFPFAGGTSLCFQRLANILAPDIDMRTVELPGRGRRFGEPLVHRIPRMMDLVFDEAVEATRAPYAVFGHSMGARLAHCFIRRVGERGFPLPRMLFVAAARPPHEPAGDAIHELPEAEFMAALRSRGAPAAVFKHESAREVFLRVLRADLEADADYVLDAKATLTVPIVAMAGESDIIRPGVVRGWRHATSHECAFYELPGDHFFVTHSPDAVASLIRRHV